MTYETFAGRAGETFRDSEAGFDLVLETVEDTSALARTVAEGGRKPFALLFRGPAEPVVPQSIRPLVHDELGDLPIFLVPVERAAEGVRYHAVFN